MPVQRSVGRSRAIPWPTALLRTMTKLQGNVVYVCTWQATLTSMSFHTRSPVVHTKQSAVMLYSGRSAVCSSGTCNATLVVLCATVTYFFRHLT